MSEVKKLSMQPTPTQLNILFDSDGRTGYHIPLYQRDFTWGEVEVSDFLQDAIDAYKDSCQRFYGTLLLSDNAPQHDTTSGIPTKYVIDGQQRLTISLLTLAAMRHLAVEISAEKTAVRCNDRITIDTKSGRKPRLFANRVNSEFMTVLLAESTSSYQDVQKIFKGIKPKVTQNRCQALFDAYRNCYRSLRGLVVQEVQGVTIDEDSDKNLTEFLTTSEEVIAARGKLDEFRSSFLNNSIFIQIEVTEWKESFELFDGLNNRGMELAKKDVLKNVVLSRAASKGEKSAVDEVHKEWQSFDELTQKFDFSRFLRHWLLLEHANVSLGGAARKFEQLTRDEPAKKTIRRLVDSALDYSVIASPDATLLTKEEHRLYTDLNLLSAERVRPIMLAARLKGLPPKQVCELLQALERLQFRRSAICQLDNKTLESSVQKIASSLYVRGATDLKKVVAEIDKLSPDNGVFMASFQFKSGMPSSIARYMLLKIENHLRAENGQPALDFDDVTLEHILPQKPETHWKMDSRKPEVKVLIGRLGNLTLLRRTKNSEASNFSFGEKKKIYGKKEHSLFISKEVITQKKWTETEIDSRQQKLASYAEKIWKK